MHHAPHAGLLAGAGQFFRQLNMGTLERGLVALQDGHQIDHRIVPCHQFLQARWIMNVRLDQLQGRPSVWSPLAELTPTPGGRLLPAMATVHIQAGRKEKIRPGDVLGALTADLGYTREQVGKIDINEFATYVAVDRRIAREAVTRLNSGRIKGRSVKARLLVDEA